MGKLKISVCVLAAIAGLSTARAQQKVLNFAHGHFDQWIVREIKESAVIGGTVREVYAIGPRDTIKGDIPYRRSPKTPWATSNVMAKVSGVTKCSVTVFPEKRGNGYCARLDTRLETVKVLGLINITVLASGTVFLGEMDEPITSTKNPMSKLLAGVPFTDRPAALIFDYKFRANGEKTRTYAPGFGSMKEVPGEDYADVTLILQKRWEDANGNVFAHRVGTLNERIGKNTPEWVNGHSIPVRYGNIKSSPSFEPQMDLLTGDQQNYCRNSKGKIVPIQEIGWASADEKPTHLMLQMSSSYGGAYTGSVGNSLWVDNIKLAY